MTLREPWVIQRFLPEVKHGDKRIVLIDGEFAGAINRVPAREISLQLAAAAPPRPPTSRRASARSAGRLARS